MIRVNLLQIKRKKRAKPLPAFTVLGILLFVVTIAIAAFVYMGLNGKIAELNRTKGKNEKVIAELRKKVKEVDDYEAKIKTFEERKKVIEGLRANQSIPVKVSNEIAFMLADGVWLNSLELKAQSVKMSGFGFTNSNIVEFVDNLKRSPMFLNVYLIESKESEIEKISVFKFSLTFQLKV